MRKNLLFLFTFFGMLAYNTATAEKNELQDANPQIIVSLENQICEGETTKLIIDTVGTGRILQPQELILEVYEEIIGETSSKIHLNMSDGILFANVSPSKDARYKVIYKYKDKDYSPGLYDLKVWNLPSVKLESFPEGRICEGETVEIFATSKPEVQLLWNETDEFTEISSYKATILPTVSDYNSSYSTTKSYSVIAQVKNDLIVCPPKEYTIDITVDKPLVFFNREWVACEGECTTLDASECNADSYKWISEEDNTVISTDSRIEVCPKEEIGYQVFMERGACKIENNLFVNVKERPSIESIDSMDYNKAYVAILDNYPPFSLSLDGTEIDSDLINLTGGEHTIKVTNAYGCSSEKTFTWINNTGLDDAVSQSLEVYPNPATDKLYLPNSEDNTDYTIYDITGQKLLQQATYPINVAVLPAGIYIIESNGKKARFVKE